MKKLPYRLNEEATMQPMPVAQELVFDKQEPKGKFSDELKNLFLPHLDQSISGFYMFVGCVPILALLAAIVASGVGIRTLFNQLMTACALLMVAGFAWIFKMGLLLSLNLSVPLVCLVLISFLLHFLFQGREFVSTAPASFKLSRYGLERKWIIFDFLEISSRTEWAQIRKVTGRYVENKRGERIYALFFETRSGKVLLMTENYIPEREKLESVIEGVRQWAGHCCISLIDREDGDAESISYTRIWLESLSQSQSRRNRDELRLGATLGRDRFTVIKKLGAGGQGTAYLAEMSERAYNLPSLKDAKKKRVVLKEFIMPGASNMLLSREIIGRMQHESMLLQRLDHPSIIKLIDFFIEDMRGYLVLEHVDGISLRALVRENGALSESRVRDLAGQLLDILSYLHSQSPPVVHRDFTPDNLIVTAHGEVKLIDFNLALSAASTETAMIVGKAAYMPPEQLRGSPLPESDLYALGATLYFLLTGEDPEPLTSVWVRDRRKSVSFELSHLIQTLTCQQSEFRPQSADKGRELLSSPLTEAV